MRTASRPHDPDGLELVDAYDRARRAYAEYSPPAGTRPDRARRERLLLDLARVDAEAELYLYVYEHGPIEAGRGIYRLDGAMRLTFRRRDHPAVTGGGGGVAWR
jgi:hypothetical protein